MKKKKKGFIITRLFGIGNIRLEIQEDITAYESAKISEFFNMLNLGASFRENQHFIDTFSIIKRHFKIV